MIAPVTESLLAALDPRPGHHVLELAAGTGDLTDALAARGAHVLATDLSPAMVEAARRRGADAEHRVMDMQALDLPDRAFDGVVCRFGYMLVPDRMRALRETRRVLKAEGRLAFATWAPAKRNPWATAYGPVLIDRGLMEPPRPDEPGQFSLGEPELIVSLVGAAGFTEVAVDEVQVEFRFRDWGEYRRVLTSLGALLKQTLAMLDEATRTEVDAAARDRVDRFRTPDGYVLPGIALVTSAR